MHSSAAGVFNLRVNAIGDVKITESALSPFKWGVVLHLLILPCKCLSQPSLFLISNHLEEINWRPFTGKITENENFLSLGHERKQLFLEQPHYRFMKHVQEM